mgnify:CR=1 FL=1
MGRTHKAILPHVELDKSTERLVTSVAVNFPDKELHLADSRPISAFVKDEAVRAQRIIHTLPICSITVQLPRAGCLV